MVYCPNCGKKNPDSAVNCKKCGASLIPTARPTAPLPTTTQQPPSQPPPLQPPKQAPPPLKPAPPRAPPPQAPPPKIIPMPKERFVVQKVEERIFTKETVIGLVLTLVGAIIMLIGYSMGDRGIPKDEFAYVNIIWASGIALIILGFIFPFAKGEGIAKAMLSFCGIATAVNIIAYFHNMLLKFPTIEFGPEKNVTIAPSDYAKFPDIYFFVIIIGSFIAAAGAYEYRKMFEKPMAFICPFRAVVVTPPSAPVPPGKPQAPPIPAAPPTEQPPKEQEPVMY